MFNRQEYIGRYNKYRYQAMAEEQKKEYNRKINKRLAQIRRENKQRAINLLGGKCQRCGYNKCVKALEFHHPDSKQKDAHMSNLWRRPWRIIEKELQKCVLLCSNCHREVD